MRADLEAGAANHVARIMPMGDSITYGVVTSADSGTGGYRPALLSAIEDDGLAVDLVGSVSSGGAGLADPDHEGHPGWTIPQLRAEVDAFLSAGRPDAILLMIGTNDTDDYSVEQMLANLSGLIDDIFGASPDTHLFLATIPPADPERDAARLVRSEEYNAALPDLVAANAAAGRSIALVDMSAVTAADLADPVHPTAEGYLKIAEAWKAALDTVPIELGSYAFDRDSLDGIENLVGSNFDDHLAGSAGANRLAGGLGDDHLAGRGGDDILDGGGGIDVMTGGAGADRFIWDAADLGAGVDVITDFDPSADSLDVVDALIGPAGPAAPSAEWIRYRDEGEDTIVSVDRDGAGDRHGFLDLVRLEGVASGDLLF